jgi:hypothetical protein
MCFIPPAIKNSTKLLVFQLSRKPRPLDDIINRALRTPAVHGGLRKGRSMANSKLTKAKNAKNDEFYTQYSDIEKELNVYLEYDPNLFRDKTVLLPCDDPE